MTQEEFDKAPLLDQILYDSTGMLVKNHPDIAEVMEEYHQAKLKLLGIAGVSYRRELFKNLKPKIMIDNYLKDLEEMSERGADFAEYYHKLLDGIKDLEDNQKAMFVYALMNAIRDIGFENGKRAANEAMIKFLNCS